MEWDRSYGRDSSRPLALWKASQGVMNHARTDGFHPKGCRPDHEGRLAFALYRNGCGEDFLAQAQAGGRINHSIEPTIGPDGMDATVEGDDTLVVAVLIVGLGERISGAFVAHSSCHLDIASKGYTAIG